MARYTGKDTWAIMSYDRRIIKDGFCCADAAYEWLRTNGASCFHWFVVKIWG